MTIHSATIAEIMTRSNVGFGTSGARGRVVDMTPPVCYAYTLGFLQYLRDAHGLRAGTRVALAGDLRPSTPDIMAACAQAVVDAGHTPVNCGFIPSPAVANYGLHHAIPALMVTGSHIPDDRNGIKFNRPDGEILKKDEDGIRAQRVVPRDDLSFAEAATRLPPVNDAAGESYLRRYLDFFPTSCLRGLVIGVYEHSGVARDLLAVLLNKLGADVVRLGRSDRFIPVDTEAIRAEDVQLARGWAGEQDLDAIVSTDGDADRPLIGTEQGEWIRGDVVGVLCAHYLGIKHVVTPVNSNTAVERCRWFEQVLRTRIGSPYVVAGMQAVADPGTSVAGYEANGGFLLGSDIERDGRVLRALPTRDAVLPTLSVLLAARHQHCRLSELVKSLPARYTASDRCKDFPTEKSRTRIAMLAAEQAALQRMFGPICGEVMSVDTTDGLRAMFANGEIIHLRPSGNAPELRCYNEAHTHTRVNEINQACMRVLAGWR